MGVVFVLDLAVPHGYAVPVLYALPAIFAAYALPGRSVATVFGLTGAMLTALGFWLSRGSATVQGGVNRGIELTVVWGCLYFSLLLSRLRTLQAESQDRLSATFEGVPVGLAMTDAEGQILLANAQLETLFGYSHGELVGRSIDALVPQELAERHSAYRRGYLADPVTRRMGAGRDLRARRRDGSEFQVEVGLKPVQTAEGRVTLSSVVDISERKRMEQALLASNEALEQSNLELQQFAYVASHDLQAPLRHISGFVQLLQERYEGKLDAQADEWIAGTVDGAARMQTLIHDLLSLSRVDSRSQPFGIVDLNDAAVEATKLLEASIADAGAQITCDELPCVSADRPQMNQLLQNLIGNAIKYQGFEPPRVHLSARRTESEWIISVTDNGIGIDPKHRERIFEIFRRLHTRQDYPGNGIGLALCKRIVARHGGRIWVEEAASGRGSCFSFSLPEAATKP